MADLKNCVLPDDLFYHVEYNTWLRAHGDGSYQLGMTDIAQSMAGSVIHCRAKKVGKKVKAGKSVATVESGKWVGPVKSPIACEIVARNDAVEADAAILNRSPYQQGWIVRITPEEGATVENSLLQGAQAVEKFRAYMEEHDLSDCVHCEGFDG